MPMMGFIYGSSVFTTNNVPYMGNTKLKNISEQQTKLMKSYLYLDVPREKLLFLSGSRIKEEEKVTLGAISSLFRFFWH